MSATLTPQQAGWLGRLLGASWDSPAASPAQAGPSPHGVEIRELAIRIALPSDAEGIQPGGRAQDYITAAAAAAATIPEPVQSLPEPAPMCVDPPHAPPESSGR